MKEILLLLVMFWNVENYFDSFDDPHTADEEFTPRGKRGWTWKKFCRKRDGIAKTILLVKDRYGVFPAVIGMAEVENHFVLKQLAENTAIAGAGYEIIHRDSPDKRGIDAAMLYRGKIFRPIKVRFITIPDSIAKTRQILYVKGLVRSMDTLHCIVVHWPSKFGGARASYKKRMSVSMLTEKLVDSIRMADKRARLVIMGDFNDSPHSKAAGNLHGLHNMAPCAKVTGGKLSRFGKIEGSHKYRGNWERIDQFIVSPNLLLNRNKDRVPFLWIYCKKGGMEIFAPDFLLEHDDSFLGIKPRRTYSGPRYLGGISDHLPVILKLYGPDY